MNKELLKRKNFVFPNYLIEIINKYQLSINETLLLLAFINGDLVFDTEQIAKDIKLSIQDIMLAFNKLVHLNLIKLETKKDSNGKREEIINLDYLYNEVLGICEEEQKESIKSDIFSVFETEFGRTISPMEYEIIKAWIEKDFSEEMVLGALKEAVYNGINSIRYIDRILHEWKRKGYKTMEDVSNHNIKNNESTPNDSEDLFDYNWLDDDNE